MTDSSVVGVGKEQQRSAGYTLHPALRKRHVKKIRRAERGSEAKKTTRPGEDASGRRGGLLEKVEGEPGPSGVAETNQPEEEQGGARMSKEEPGGAGRSQEVALLSLPGPPVALPLASLALHQGKPCSED